MLLIKNFKDLNKEDVAIAGGKGASLGEMTQAGIPVPPGFVILSDTFERFIEETDLNIEIEAILKKVDIRQTHTVEDASEQIQALVLSKNTPLDIKKEIISNFKELKADFVAVRSSATSEDSADAAWAGQLDSFLNTTEKKLLENVKKCWASLFTPRAIFYRFEKKLDKNKISVAVVVQKMIQSEMSGIAFSVHPVTEDENQIIIEAGFGLGEAIVSGSVTPDSYVVHKKEMDILDINVNEQNKALYKKANGGNEWKNLGEKGKKQVLSEKEIIDLSSLIVKIENHYDFPCDIEWAREKGKFYIVQSRPITTLKKTSKKKENKVKKKEKQIFEKEYTRAFSIIMQQAWFSANNERFCSKIGIKEFPFFPPYIFFMKDGVEEVWVNKEAKKFIIDNIKKRVVADKEFFLDIHKSYFERLSELKKNWDDEINTLNELKIFIDKVYDGISDFVILYEALKIASLKKKYKKLAEQFRKEDTFFNDCNEKIIKALDNVYLGLDYTKIYITREELGKTIDRKDLKKRDNGFVLIPGVFKGCISFDEFVYKNPEFKFNIEQVEESTNFIKGQSAYKGIVRGNVRIVKRADQLNKINEGDILVSPMTTPDFVPAMKIALGFVTDEGGVTCHAAIFAREMGKPCIIGTKNATQILQDGDLVEVDANKGIVKILKKNNDDLNKKKIIENIKLMKWEKWLERPFNAFTLSLFEDSSKKENFEKIGFFGVDSLPQLFQNGFCYLNKEGMEKMDQQVGANLEKYGMFGVTEKLEKFKKTSQKRINFLLKSTKPLEEKLKEVFDILNQACVFIWVTHGIESYYNKKLKTEVPKYFTGDLEKFIGDASFPKKKNTNVIFDSLMRSKISDKALVKKFGWLKIRDGFSEPFSLSEIKKMRKELPLKKIFVPVKIPKELKKLFEQIQELVFFRTERTDVFFQLFFQIRPILFQLAKKHNINFKDLSFYRAKSFIDNKIEKFVPLCSFAFDGVDILFQNEPVIQEINFCNTEIQGNPAFKGVIRGSVKIVKNSNELDKVKKGDILVTPMTFPSFVPAMNRAVAFVTDEGGVTCHAAIIAREMGKPCIIGTKNATQILQDGDLVEVDANKGIVKILKKNNNVLENDKILINIFSREKNLIYFCMWDDSDRKGMQMIGENIKNNLFIVPPIGQKGSVWYEKKELDVLKNIVIAKHKYFKNNFAWNSITKLAEESWQFIKPYAKDGRKIKGDKEFKLYYSNLVNFWVCLNSIFYEVADNSLIDKKIRDYLINFRNKTEKYTEKMSVLLSDYLSCHPKLKKLKTVLHFLTIKEVIDILEDKIKIKDLNEIKKRVEGCFMLNGVVYPSKKIKEILKINNLTFERNDLDVNVIKGDVAFGGLAKGKVVIIDGFKDLDKIQDGDILVTQMTNPKYLPALKKSLAIVTDQGGTLCHAAITARELKKPCIIGTKNATQILQDGDLVEVDANKGIVKILEKKNNEKKENNLAENFLFELGNQELRPPVYDSSIFVHSSGWQTKKYIDKYYKDRTSYPLIILTKQKEGLIFLPATKEKNLSEEILTKYWQDNAVIFDIKKQFNLLAKKIEKLDERLNYKFIKNNSFDELTKLFINLGEYLWELNALMFFSIYIDKKICEKVIKKSNINISVKRLNEIWPKASTPIGISFEKKRELYLFSMLSKGAPWNLIAEKCQYFFTTYNKILPVDEVKENLFLKYGKLKKIKIDELIKSELKMQEKRQNEFKKWSKSLSNEEKKLVDFIQFAIELRDNRKSYIMKAITLFYRYAEKLFEKYNIEKNLIMFYGVDELVKGEKYFLDSIIELKKRVEGCTIFIHSDGRHEYEYGLFEKNKKFINDHYLKQQDATNEKEIKGQTGCPGVVRGSVRVITNFEIQKNDLKDGEILVTCMTRPEFVPMMKKSLGIITDEGGITCHAAIVSRELKKPCVIGTKIATQVLQDGDLVELDADNGIVKILEKNNNEQKLLVNISNDFWKKSWSLKYNLLLSSYSAEQYTKELFKYVGANIPRTIIICKDGISTGYVTSKEADAFALYLAKKISKNEEVIKKWAENLIKNGKKLTKTIKKKEKQIPFLKEIKKKDYDEFIKDFFDYANAHFVVKRTLDCLTKEKQEKFVSIMQDARQKTENVYALVEEFVYKYISILDIKNNYSIESLLYLTNREINKYFDNGDLPSEKILSERKNASALIVDKGNYKIIMGGKDVEELEKNIVVSNNDEVLKGVSVFPGKVTGKVKVIKNSKDYNNFNLGDILVTVMTRPEHIKFFHKALAIITDAGGILSHAAISAREFKKPCIIGTNNATQVLQDGDLVELDANEGLIKILSRASKDILKKNLNNIPKIYQEFEKKLEGHEKFTFYGPHSPLVIGGVAWGNEKYFKKYFSKLKVIPAYLHLVNGRIVISIIDNDAYRNCAVQKFKDFIDGKVTLTQLKKDYKKVNKQVNELYSKKIINPEDTIKKAYNLILHLFAVTLYAEIFTKEIVEDILKIKIKNSVWEKVANPPFDHFERRWDQLIKKTKNPLKIDFVFMNYYFLPSTKNIYKKWEEEKNKPAVKKTKGYIMNKEKWMKYTQFVIELRDIRKDAIAKIGSLLCKSARMIYPELTDDILAHLNPLEIIENKKPSEKELERRLSPYVLSVDSDLGYKYDYNSYNKIKSIIDYAEKRPDFIKGFSAKKGNYKGIVKIIFDPIKADFEKGNILVTSMTRPEFVPLMRKAGAIITNEGGVTCHAAIISRELGIPCVIGTKNATQILKDGDLVEVDADNGIVRILNK